MLEDVLDSSFEYQETPNGPYLKTKMLRIIYKRFVVKIFSPHWDTHIFLHRIFWKWRTLHWLWRTFLTPVMDIRNHKLVLHGNKDVHNYFQNIRCQIIQPALRYLHMSLFNLNDIRNISMTFEDIPDSSDRLQEPKICLTWRKRCSKSFTKGLVLK